MKNETREQNNINAAELCSEYDFYLIENVWLKPQEQNLGPQGQDHCEKKKTLSEFHIRALKRLCLNNKL